MVPLVITGILQGVEDVLTVNPCAEDMQEETSRSELQDECEPPRVVTEERMRGGAGENDPGCDHMCSDVVRLCRFHELHALFLVVAVHASQLFAARMSS